MIMEFSLDILRNRTFRLALYGAFGVIGLIITAVGFVLYYPDFTFHMYLASALVVVIVAPAFYVLWDEGRKKKIDNMLPRMLEDIAEGQESGLTLLRSFELSSKRNYGPLSRELKLLVAQLTWGVEFEDALRLFAERIDTETRFFSISVFLTPAMYEG